MTLHQLTIFTVVAKHLNTRAAAEKLHISQPSVSKQLRALEKEFGANFHIKVGRRIELTREGGRFLKDAQALLIQVEKLKKNFDYVPTDDKASTLKVGGSYNPSGTFLPAALALFEKSHPLVQIELKTDTRRAVERMVLNGEVDIAAVSNLSVSADLVTEPFCRERLLAFASPSHPLAKRFSIAISDLAHIPLVIRGERGGERTATEEILREIANQGVEIKIAMRCDSYESVKAAVRNHMGVGLLFEGLVRRDAKRGDFKILKINGLNLFGQSFIIYPKEKPLTQNARDFLDLLRKQRPKRWLKR